MSIQALEQTRDEARRYGQFQGRGLLIAGVMP